jgi:hypothetical protein
VATSSQELSYKDFGEAFILAAVTPERLISAVKRIAGDSVELGPLRAGPGGAAVVTAQGTIGEPIADELGSELLSYAVRLPVDVFFQARVGATGKFKAKGEVTVRLTVRTVHPLAIVIDVHLVSPRDVTFVIEARGVQSRLMQMAADIEGELKAHTAAFVNEQISRPEAARLTRIELLPMIEAAWETL